MCRWSISTPRNSAIPKCRRSFGRRVRKQRCRHSVRSEAEAEAGLSLLAADNRRRACLGRISAVRATLRRSPVGPRAVSGIPEKSIAVLPFENLSEDKDNAYFADGIQDEILTRLAKIADLKVISRTSTQHYKSAPENLPEIAKTTWRRPHPGRKRAEERRRRAGERAANQSSQ